MKGFFWPRTQYANDQAAFEVQQKIVEALRDIT